MSGLMLYWGKLSFGFHFVTVEKPIVYRICAYKYYLDETAEPSWTLSSLCRYVSALLEEGEQTNLEQAVCSGWPASLHLIGKVWIVIFISHQSDSYLIVVFMVSTPHTT